MPAKNPQPLKGLSLLQRVNTPSVPPQTLSREEKPAELERPAAVPVIPAPEVPAEEEAPSPVPASAAPAKTPKPAKEPKQDREYLMISGTTKSVRLAPAIHKKLMYAALDNDMDFTLLLNRILFEWEQRYRRKETGVPPPMR